MAKCSLFVEDLDNYARFLCINQPYLIELSIFVHQNYPFVHFICLMCQNCCYLRAFLGVKFSSRILLCVKELTFRNSVMMLIVMMMILMMITIMSEKGVEDQLDEDDHEGGGGVVDICMERR